MLNKKIAIVGAGNMGQAIAFGLLQKKAIQAKYLTLTDPNIGQLKIFEKKGVLVESDNKQACRNASVIVLAVKPQVLKSILNEVQEYVQEGQLIMSIVAGTSIELIKEVLGKEQPVVRVMPNLCAQVSESMSGWIKSKEVNEDQINTVKIILNSIGNEILFKKEDDINKVTAVSGSGPAYAFYLAEMLEKSAIQIGIKKKYAKILAENTLIGAAKFLENSSESAQSLRKKVTSKGGTTEAAFKKINNSKLEQIFCTAVKAAYDRAKSLAK